MAKLNLGAGRQGRQEGWLNCDLHPGPNVDHVFNLMERWPFEDNSVTEIYSSHVLEHLPDPWAFFREAHRVLVPNGTCLIRVPYGGHHAAWWDLTHVRPWFSENFAFLQPGYDRACGNPQHDAWQSYFAVHIVQQRVSYKLAKLLRRWWWRWVFVKHPWLFDREIEELWAHLSALKTPEAIQEYQKDHRAEVVSATFTAWKHHYTGSAPPTDGSNTMIDLCQGVTINGFIGRVLSEER